MNGKFNFRQEGYMAHDFFGEHKTREHFWVKLRKSKRSEKIQLKRDKNFISLQALPAELISEVYLLKNIPENEVTFTDICKLLPVTSHLDILLDYLRNTFILKPQLTYILKEQQLTQTLLSILNYNSPTSTLANACLILCNYIASADVSDELLSNNIVPILISIINPCSVFLIENILWCFANIALEGKNQAQILINENLIEIIFKLNIDLKPVLSNTLIKAFGFFYFSIVRYPDLLNDVSVKQMAKLITETMKDVKSLNIKNYLEVLIELAKTEEFIDIIIEMNIPDLVLSFIENPKYTYKVLLFIQLIVSGNTLHTFYMIKKPIFDMFEMYIYSENPRITEVILFSLSNIISVTKSIENIQKYQFFQRSNIFLTHSDEKVKIEASFLLKTVINNTSFQQKKEIFSLEYLGSLLSAFDSKNSDLIMNLLICSYGLLKFLLKEVNIVYKELTLELVQKISKQVDNKNLEVSEMALEILSGLNY